MYIDSDSIRRSIDKLSAVNYTAGKNSGYRDCFAMLLLLLRAGSNELKWIKKDELYKNKSNLVKGIYQLGGLFSDDEEPGKKACLFFTSFYQIGALERKSFYNPASIFNQLFGRLKDTIDNSVADYVFDKGMDDSYRLKPDYGRSVASMYDKKFPFDAVVIWVNRHRDIGDCTIGQLRNAFREEYNLNSDTVRLLFDVSDKIDLKLSENGISSDDIRLHLTAEKFVEVTRRTAVGSLKFNTVLHYSESYLGSDYMITAGKLHKILNKNKQVVLTGVPGTGKTYILGCLGNYYETVEKIQFHQNYSYQDFIHGKSIENGGVVDKLGALLNLLGNIKAQPDKLHLLILDEINRGNISAIFGEFLYALDRDESISIKMIEKEFDLQLPDNLHIIGTMNTADRSIAMVDFAIRRRFMFIELKPNYEVVDELSSIEGETILGKFLEKINDKIIDVFENVDYQLGHSYFIRQGQKDWTAEDLFETLNFKIFPMIVEYAHGDKKHLNNIFGVELVEASEAQLLEKVRSFIDG